MPSGAKRRKGVGSVEAGEIHEKATETMEARHHTGINRTIAITVSLVALVMVLGKVKDDNIMRRMFAAQTAELDDWNYFQARSIKAHMFELQAQQWQLASATMPSPLTDAQRARIGVAVKKWQGEADRENAEKDKLQRKAEGEEKEYESLRLIDHQFHFAEALLTLAVTLLAVAALTQGAALYAVGVVIAALGCAVTLTGFLGWQIELSFLKFLT